MSYVSDAIVEKLAALAIWVDGCCLGDNGERPEFELSYRQGRGYSIWASSFYDGHANVDDVPDLLVALTEVVERLDGAEERQREDELRAGASWLVRAVPGLSTDEAVAQVRRLREERR